MSFVLDTRARQGLARIRRDPVGWCESWLGDSLWEKQKEILCSVRDNRRTSVKSCHSGGKSFVAARAVLWYLHAHPDSVVITTAPTFNQVQNVLWRELRTAASRSKLPLLGRALTVRYEIDTKWYAMGFKSADTDSSSFQGFHAERILLVIDEAAGVAEPVFEATNAMMTSQHARMLLIGNPTSVSGSFYDSHHKMRDRYNCITISAEDTPNLKAGRTVRNYLITQEWIDDAVAAHGEDSPYVQSRVFANFPTIGINTIIPLSWIEQANAQDIDVNEGEIEAGLDIARYGDDLNALCIRRGPKVLLEEVWSGVDTMTTVAKVRQFLALFPGLARIKVDGIGVGGGVVDRLIEMDYPVIDVNVGARSSDPTKWPNFRHEMWWQARERFRDLEIIGPIREETIAQLSSVRYSYRSSHTHPIVEDKEQMKKRGLKSPDRAEALLLAFARVPNSTATWEVF
jgi:phage terminase large subunit